MIEFAAIVASGFASGAVYALMAIGFVMIYRSTWVVNFAQGSLALFGAFVVAKASIDLGFFPSVLVGAAAVAVAGVVIDWFLVRPLAVKGISADVATIATIGVDLVLTTYLTRRIGVDILGIDTPWRPTVAIGDITIATSHMVAIGATLALLAGLGVVMKWSLWGIAVQGAVEEPEAAELVGVRRRRVAGISWTIAGALAAAGGVLLAAPPAPGVDASLAPIAMTAFPAAIIGGLSSPLGAAAAAMALGLIQGLVVGYVHGLGDFQNGIGNMVPWLVMLLVLIWKPDGLLGHGSVDRV